MLNIGNVTRQTSGKLQSYYAQDDYYFQYQEGPEIVGTGVHTINKRLEELGITPGNTLSQEKFLAITTGREVLAKDVTFSAPKSVSIVHAMGDDRQRKDMFLAHDRAVNSALSEIENKGLFRTQKKENGQVKTEAASGMMAAKFHHGLSREEDPQLHTHSLIMNTGLDSEGVERGVNYQQIFKHQKHLDQVYKSTMRQELERMGYGTKRSQEGWELEGIDRSQVEAFSTRKNQIDAALESKGISRADSTAKQREMEALSNRRSKSTHSTQEERVVKWATTGESVGLDVDSIRRKDRNDRMRFGLVEKEKVLGEAFKEYTENNAVFTRTSLEKGVYDYAEAKDFPLTPKDIDGYLNRSDISENFETLPGQAIEKRNAAEEKITTSAMLQAEYENGEFLKQGNGVFLGKTDPQSAEKIDAVASESFSFKFEGEQRAAAVGILTSEDFITCVQGDPGTGKTTMLQAVVEAHGKENVLGLAIAGTAAKKLGDETGIEARTVARLVIDNDRRKEALKTLEEDPGSSKAWKVVQGTQYIDDAFRDRRGLVIVDEASMVGSMDANRLAHIAHENGAKLILVGDRQQLPGVGAGKPFEDFQDKGAATYRLSEIRRQNTDRERRAVEAITQNQDAAKAVKILESGNERIIKEYEKPSDRKKAIVNDYLKTFDERGKAPFLITSLNADRNDFNERIRAQMITRGEVASKGQLFEVESQNGKISEREFAQGDRIILLEGDTRGRVATDNGSNILNGTEGKVLEVQEGRLKMQLEDGRKAEIDTEKYMRFDHAYALSTYKSQGQSVDERVIYHAPHNSPLLTKNEFLVGISRNKNDVVIYTDDKQKMIKKAQQWVKKKTALQEYKAGWQRQEGSGYLNEVNQALEQRREGEALIMGKRKEMANQAKDGKWANVPAKNKSLVNNALNANRERFEKRIDQAEALKADRPMRVEADAYQRVQGWREARQDISDKNLQGANSHRAANTADRSLDKDFQKDYAPAQATKTEKDRVWQPQQEDFFNKNINEQTIENPEYQKIEYGDNSISEQDQGILDQLYKSDDFEANEMMVYLTDKNGDSYAIDTTAEDSEAKRYYAPKEEATEEFGQQITEQKSNTLEQEEPNSEYFRHIPEEEPHFRQNGPLREQRLRGLSECHLACSEDGGEKESVLPIDARIDRRANSDLRREIGGNVPEYQKIEYGDGNISDQDQGILDQLYKSDDHEANEMMVYLTDKDGDTYAIDTTTEDPEAKRYYAPKEEAVIEQKFDATEFVKQAKEEAQSVKLDEQQDRKRGRKL